VQLGLGPIPALAGPGGVVVTTDSLYMAAASDPLQRAGAWRFIDWFEQPAQQARWAILTGSLPARRSATVDPSLADLWAQFPLLKQAWTLLTMSPWRVPDLIGPTFSALGGVGDALGAAQAELVSGTSVTATLTGAAAAADRAIATYNADPAAWDGCDGLTTTDCAARAGPHTPSPEASG